MDIAITRDNTPTWKGLQGGRRGAAGSLAVLAACAGILGGCSSNDDDDSFTPVTPPPLVPGDSFVVSNNNRIVSFNRSAPGTAVTDAAITGLQAGETILGIDIRPGGTPAGELYALTSAGRLYVIAATSGAATLKSTLAADPTDTTLPYTALSGTDYGLDFNPVVDRLRVVSNGGQNLRINVDTGATLTDGALSTGGVPRTGVTATAYTNSFAAACRTTLYYVDAATDQLLSTSDPNGGALTVVGPLGVDADGVNGFEIVTAADGVNTALAVFGTGAGLTLRTVNLTTGAIAAGGAIGLNAGETLRGLALAPPATAPVQAAGALFGVTETNRLVSFNAATPQKLCTTVATTGLQAAENILGIDVRPADGALYALGSTGRLYTLAASGVATLKSQLSADPADTTAPFTALGGTDFGLDFNPVPDRLRVVSNTGQNLRINVDSGATTTDTALNPAGSTVTAAAYSNSFAGAGSTTLYALDVANDRLVIQGRPSGNPNSGDLLAVGALAVGDLQVATGFDIAGASNSAVAAVTLSGASTSDLVTIDLATGTGTRVNTIGGAERLRGLALATAPVATVFGATSDNRLVSFRATTPAVFDSNVAITGLQGGENVAGLDFRPATGGLYLLTDSGRVYLVNPASGAASAAISMAPDAADTTAPFTALVGTSFGVDFNPVVDRLRTVSNGEQNLRSNVETGATTTDTALARTAPAVSAAAYTNSFAPAPTTTVLYVIDTQADRLLIQNPPNNGTLEEVGALGLDVTAVNAFEIIGPATAVAALSSTVAPTGLYGLDLATGAATLVGNVALPQAGDRITGLTALPSATAPVANSTVVALVNGTALVAFARNAPATAVAPTPVTGLATGERLLGIDYRPANAALYGLGSSGRLYQLDATTAVATPLSTLAADLTDLTSPYAALAGTDFGLDFNPVADRLRVVSNTGQNLRINVTNGAVITDGALAYPVPDVVAAAYTRSFAGTASTQLLVIDVASHSLLLQNPPNDGVLAAVGRLDPLLSFDAAAGFDIAGGEDGLPLAALLPVGATQPVLYRVNLATGAATALGAIGPAGSAGLRGLSIRLQ